MTTVHVGATGAGDAPDEPSARPRALIDGSNVAHATEGGARLANILLVRDRLRDQGFDPIIVADAALRHQIDDGAGYETLVAAGEIHQAPAGTDADYFLLSFARELDASLVSNDRFRDRSRQFAAVRRQIIRFMIVAEEVVFERRTGRRPARADAPARGPRPAGDRPAGDRPAGDRPAGDAPGRSRGGRPPRG